jgi:hypothetical protein
MDINKDFNQDEIIMLIKKELEEDLTDDKKSLEIDEVNNYFDEPGIQTISDKLIKNNSLRINNNNTHNNDIIKQNNSNNFDNSMFNQPQIKMNNKSKKCKIFNIVKSPRHKVQKLGYKIFKIKKIKQEKNRLRQFINWDTIQVPKEKHFNFDRIKHRIIFQRKHLKVIYSLNGLSPPFDFIKCFELIKNHIGDKTLQNFGKVKSFHIIRKNGNEKIVTLKDKKIKMKKFIFVNKRIDSKNDK